MKTYLKVLLSQILIWTAIHHTQAKSILTYPLTDKDDISIVSEDNARTTDSERLTPIDFIITGNESIPSITNDSSDTDFSTLSTFTTNGSSTTFSDPAAWVGGIEPPNDGTADIVIDHNISLDENYTVANLTVNVNDTLRINPGIVLKVNGDIINNGLIYFESDGVNGSAQLDEYNGSVNDNIGVTTVERFIPARFGNRYITTPITTSGSIRDNWQEGVNNTGTSFPSENLNPNPGFGTHISGGDVSKGFDLRSTGFVGMKYYNLVSTPPTVSEDFTDIENTNLRVLRAGEPFFLYYRGDRSINMEDNVTPPVTSSRLRSTGTLHTGLRTYNVGNPTDYLDLNGNHIDYNFIGNPYQSVVDYRQIDRDDLTNYIYIWDIHLGGAEGRGGYVVVDTPLDPMEVTAPSPWSSEASRFIAPGMTFWVQNLPSTSTEITAPFSPSLTFDEDDKATDAAEVGVLSTYSNFYINSRVYKTSDLQSGNTESDALGLRFSSNYKNEPSLDEDAPFDLFNSKVHYKVVYDGSTLWSIEKRKVPNINDEIQLFIDYDLPLFSVTDPDTTEFSLTYEVGNKPELLPLFLKDDYENTETLITENLSYDFTIDTGIPDSTFYFRFSLVFDYPKDYYLWEAGFDDNFNNKRVFEDAAFANNIKTLTVEATADGDSANDDTYRIFERSENDKWQNASTAFNEVFTLSHGGAGSPDGITNPAASDGNYYTVQIDGYAVIDRQAVFMETDNAPIEFATNNAITLPTTEIMDGQPVTLNINLAGNKSSQERAFVVYSTNEFANSDFVEVTFSTPTSNTGDVTIPGFVNGTLVEFYAYTTTIDVNAIGTPNHDLYTLRQGKDVGENYIYNVGPEHITKGGATDWNQMSSWLRNQVPPDGSDVIIAHDLSLTDNQTVETIEFISDAVLNGTGQLNIQNGGAVFNSNAAEVSIDPTVNFIGVGSVTGEVAFNAVKINGEVNFGDPIAGNKSTINGSLTMLPTSFVNPHSPFYGDGSTLIYDIGGNYGRTTEWSNASATQGRPFNVIVVNGTILDIGSGTVKTVAAEIDGDFTIEVGAAAYMDFSGNNMEAPLIVGGDFENNGDFSLTSNSFNGNLRVSGDFTNSGNIFFNDNSVIFEGNQNQLFTAANNFEIPYVVIDKTAGQVILQQDIILNGSGTALNMSNDGVLNLNDHQLQIGDNTNTQVSFSGNAGLVGSLDSRILFKSTSEPAGNLVFKQDAIAYENYLSEFEMDGSGIIGISNTLNILRRFYLKGGEFEPNGHLTFKSSDSITAVIPEVTDGFITGDVRIERHFPESNRAFRYVSSPVTTSTSINANWQEGVNNTGTNYPSDNLNPNPGFGTHITGSTDGSDGFDATETGNFSLFTFDENNQAWNPVTSTNTNITVKEPYALMVRGDRSTSLTSNVAIGPATTLRTSGTIETGFQSVLGDAPSNEFLLVGNPYQARVDMNSVFKSGINEDYMWIFDPKLGTQGGYAIVDLSSGNQVDEDFVLVSPRTSQANQFLQPFQACFLQAVAGPPQLVFFQESDKTNSMDDIDNIGTFSDDTVQTNVLNIELEQQNTQILVDAVKLSFAPNYTTPGSFEDATKLWNSTEHLAIVNNSDYFAIDKRNLPQVNDTVPLYLGNYQESQYTLKLESTLDSSIPAILYDEYLDQTQVLNFGDNTYDFSVDNAIPESTDNQRFKLVFNPETLGIEDLVSTTPFSVYPNPTDDILYINSNKTFLGQEVELTCFDQTGRLVLSQSISKLEANTSLDLSRLSTGLYLLKLETDGHQETFKIQVR